MNLNQWFEKGLLKDQYIETLDHHKEGFFHIYNEFNLPPDEDFFQVLTQQNLRVIVLAEPWCGHCMLNIPILFRLAEKIQMPIRVMLRDENLELMDQYLTNGNRTIPIFIFIDENGNEVTTWGPITKTTKEFVSKYQKELPSKQAEGYQEKFNHMIEMIMQEFRADSSFWNNSYDDIKHVLQSKLK